MKKALAVFTVLLLTAFGFTSVFQYSLLKEKDQVNFTNKILYGDASDAEGISVTTQAHYDRHLFWKTTYEAGAAPSVSTDYTFYSTEHRMERESINSFYIDLDVQSYYLDIKKSREENTGIDRAFYDLYYDDTIFYKDDSNTLTKTKTVFLKDYYDYYPLTFHATIHDDLLFFSTQEKYIDPQEVALSPLGDFFRIPIIEDDTRLIHMQQFGASDYSSHVEYSNTYPSYYFNNYGVVTDDALLYTFTVNDSLNYDIGTSKVDFSHVPGGYGIYRIPYRTEKTNWGTDHHVDAGSISMAYSLDPSIEIFSFTVSKDNSKLFLIYRDKDTPAATTEFAVIDAKTMETLQLLQLDGVEKADGSTETLIPHSLHVDDDFIALNCSSDYLVLIELKESGLYEHVFTVNIHENPVFEYYMDFPWRTALSWNGKQLAVSSANNRELGTHRYALSCGFYLAIFDETGLVYYSEHTSSLDKGPSPMGPYTPVQPVYNDDGNLMLTVEWNETS